MDGSAHAHRRHPLGRAPPSRASTGSISDRASTLSASNFDSTTEFNALLRRTDILWTASELSFYAGLGLE
jgi:hypothetical protein